MNLKCINPYTSRSNDKFMTQRFYNEIKTMTCTSVQAVFIYCKLLSGNKTMFLHLSKLIKVIKMA